MSFGKYSFGKVSFGGALVEEVTITPSPASAIGQVVAPTVVKGSISITPDYAASIGSVVQPTVILGSTTATPEHIDAIAQVVQPTVKELTPPTATTQAASNIGNTTARINGKITDDGGESCKARFRWRKKEETEEQTSYMGSYALQINSSTRVTQKLTVANRTITKLGFWLNKAGSPTGDVTYTIRKTSDDSVICSVVWGDASSLPYSAIYKEATFSSPQNVNEEVRLCAEYSGGNSSNYVQVRQKPSDVKPDEYLSGYCTSEEPNHWIEYTSYDLAYKYTYEYDWATTEWQNTLETNDEYYEDLTELEQGTEYEFQTQAKNSAGEGAWSESAYFITAIIPSPVSAIAQVVQPNVKQGNIIFAPTPIDAIAKALNPSVICASIILEPDFASAIASVVSPVVILSSISITPDYIEAIGQVVAPIVSTAGTVYITPDPVDAIGDTVNPTVILGSVTIIPDALSAIGQVIAPKVKQSSIIFSPAFIKALGKGVNPTVIRGSLTLAPESIRAIARGENPEVILGSTTVTPEFVKALAGVVAPYVLQAWVGRKLRLVILTSQYRDIDIVTCQKRKVDVATTQKRKVRVLTGE